MGITFTRTFTAVAKPFLSWLDENFTTISTYINTHTTSDKWNDSVLLNGVSATATPTASKIIIADGTGKIGSGWLPTLDTATNATNLINSGTISATTTGGAALAVSSAATATTATKLTDGTNLIHTKIVDIGNWNMNMSGFGTTTVYVSHGVTLAKIRSVSAMVRNDNETISVVNSHTDFTIDGISSAITLTVKTGGFCDSASFVNVTAYNRGWVMVTYID